MAKRSEISTIERNEQLLEFLKNTVQEILHNFDTEFPKILEKMPEYSFLKFMVLIEEGNTRLAIQIYDAILNHFSYDNFSAWKEHQDKKIYELTFEGKIRQHQNSYIEENRIRERLHSPALPLFASTVLEWAKKQEIKEKQHYFADYPAIQKASFAPQEQESIAYSLERLWYTKRKKSNRNYSELLDLWEQSLKKYILSDIQWEPSLKEDFFTGWKNRLFNEAYPPQNPLEGRWKSGLSIDCITASRIILYFIDQFIQKPHRSVFGEIACFLWLLGFLSKRSEKHTLHELINLSSSQLQPRKQKLNFKNHQIHLSIKLSTLLGYVRKLKDTDKLFPSISIDTLSDALRNASHFFELDPKVLPEAFLTEIHPFQDLRILPWLCKIMLKPDFQSKPEYRVGGFLKAYKLPTQCFLDMPKDPLRA